MKCLKVGCVERTRTSKVRVERRKLMYQLLIMREVVGSWNPSIWRVIDQFILPPDIVIERFHLRNLRFELPSATSNIRPHVDEIILRGENLGPLSIRLSNDDVIHGARCKAMLVQDDKVLSETFIEI